jgi:hypothetical protein
LTAYMEQMDRELHAGESVLKKSFVRVGDEASTLKKSFVQTSGGVPNPDNEDADFVETELAGTSTGETKP